jgi:hypothetical protein
MPIISITSAINKNIYLIHSMCLEFKRINYHQK